MRLFLLFLLTLVPLSTTIGLAHENQLSGLLYLQPQTPISDEPFTITFELYDPEGKFIPNALLNLAIPSLDLNKSFIETSQSGIYHMDLTLPEGQWFTDLTEATFEGESNTVQLGLKVGEKNREIFEILFPVIDDSIGQSAWLTFLLCLAISGLSIWLSYVYKLNTYTFRSINKHKPKTSSFTHNQ